METLLIVIIVALALYIAYREYSIRPKQAPPLPKWENMSTPGSGVLGEQRVMDKETCTIHRWGRK